MTPDISVIIPTFRRPQSLVEAIESVLRQKGVTCEIRVVDDCHEGSAEASVAPYLDRGVIYSRSPAPSNGRPAVVRNFGYQDAKAEILHFLDDDDLVPEGYYVKALEVFAQRPDIGVVFGNIEPFGSVGIASERDFFDRAFRRARKYRRLGPKLGFSAAMFFQEPLLVCSAAMIRKRCVVEIDGFDPGPSLAEDVDFYARAIRKFGAVLLERTSIYYRIGPSLVHQPGRQPKMESSYREIHARYRREHGPVNFLALKILAKILDRFDGPLLQTFASPSETFTPQSTRTRLANIWANISL
jgi:glycosyltransferase involved in cell wall biosynthesis